MATLLMRTVQLLLLLLCISGATEAYAKILYGAGFRWLVTINTNTGTSTPVGLLSDGAGAVSIGGMDFASDGTLYGWDGGSQSQLVTINPNTGFVTRIGTAQNVSIAGLTFDDNDTLYGVDPLTNQLVSINTTTGAVTPIGAANSISADLSALAFDPDSSNLIGSDFTLDRLLTIKPATGVELAQVSLTSPFSNPFLRGLAFDDDGNLFGADNRQLVSISSAAVETVISPFNTPFGNGVTALAFGPIPEPATLTLLAVAGAMLPLLYRRRCPQTG